ncbi:MAG: hypothetical protein Aurels2KO_55580 [Aureliella sp.]
MESVIAQASAEEVTSAVITAGRQQVRFDSPKKDARWSDRYGPDVLQQLAIAFAFCRLATMDT